jgi:hypothetical protein
MSTFVSNDVCELRRRMTNEMHARGMLRARHVVVTNVMCDASM